MTWKQQWLKVDPNENVYIKLCVKSYKKQDEVNSENKIIVVQ